MLQFYALKGIFQNELVRFYTIDFRGGAEEFLRDSHPKVPWGDIAGMRNRLIHEYFRVDLGKVWDTIKNDLPRLIPLIEPLVPPNEE
jgi:uncharacterized protein with HEPN domain